MIPLIQQVRYPNKRRGFTLVELLLAIVIISFIAMVSISSLKALTTSREKINAHLDISTELRYITQMVKRDLHNIHRHPQQGMVKFTGMLQDGAGPNTILTFHCINRTKARPGKPEGDFYEVEYSILSDDETNIFARRLWPMPDPRREEPGGLLTKISEQIVIFNARFLDENDEWQEEWPEESKKLPKMIEIALAAKKPETEDLLTSSFTVTFPRWPSNNNRAPIH